MSSLAVIAWILGTFAIGGGLLAAGVPAMVRRGMDNYPRSVWPGRILLAVDLVWAAYAVNQMHLGGFDAWKVHLCWLAPVLIGAMARSLPWRQLQASGIATAVCLPAVLYNYYIFTSNPAMQAWDLQNIMITPDLCNSPD